MQISFEHFNPTSFLIFQRIGSIGTSLILKQGGREQGTTFIRMIQPCVCAPQSYPTLCGPMDHNPPGSSVHGIFPGKNTGVHCHALLQRIFPTQESNLHLLSLLYWQAGSLPLVPPGKPNIAIGYDKYWSELLGSQNRKKKSRMAVAKRQGGEKPVKIEQTKVREQE